MQRFRTPQKWIRFPHEAPMQITTHITDLEEARKDKKLMRVLFALTLRGYSEMRMTMHTIWGAHAKDCKIVLAKLNDKIIGWSLAYPYSEGMSAHFYVARSFRRKGIGTVLYNKTKEICGENMYCSSWDKVSAGFFIKNKAKICGEAWQDIILSNPTDIYID